MKRKRKESNYLMHKIAANRGSPLPDGPAHTRSSIVALIIYVAFNLSSPTNPCSHVAALVLSVVVCEIGEHSTLFLQSPSVGPCCVYGISFCRSMLRVRETATRFGKITPLLEKQLLGWITRGAIEEADIVAALQGTNVFFEGLPLVAGLGYPSETPSPGPLTYQSAGNPSFSLQ
ncbi:H/ACA ribonucleoprotein complex subunit 4 [Striga asiatica]|uniref:H/ACA ribonucleoprotein complex subunit 4 n=1 Tax=Striga asiatica TaxID=4170 RepID=A0A5A7PTN9_STRAF|nr:H/ACA ribonucleoprotein complex subunit 4 [Striga asiatica]